MKQGNCKGAVELEFVPNLTYSPKDREVPRGAHRTRALLLAFGWVLRISRSKTAGNCSLQYVCSQLPAGLLKVAKTLLGPVKWHRMTCVRG